jgi:general secretion pathway protein I
MSRRGFTLIEVLVALAVAALGLAAVLSVVTSATNTASYLRDRTLASWIALNKITELRLGATLPSPDKTSGDADYAGRKWKWTANVTETGVPGLRRIDVGVREADAAEETTLASMSGFVGKTAQSAAPTSISFELSAPMSGGALQVPAVPAVAPPLPPRRAGP